MSETEEDRSYYEAAEAAFIRRRGTPFLLSPRDFALLKEWRALGVPLEAIERGVDDAFTRREERGASGRVNSLAYCRDAVISAWERRADSAVGRGAGRAPDERDPALLLAGLRNRLEAAAKARPDLAEPLAAASRSVARAASSGKSAEETESSLSRIDRKLAAALYAALSESERASIDAEAERILAAARVRMDEATAQKTVRALTRRAVRQRLDLPRLSLL